MAAHSSSCTSDLYSNRPGNVIPRKRSDAGSLKYGLDISPALKALGRIVYMKVLLSADYIIYHIKKCLFLYAIIYKTAIFALG